MDVITRNCPRCSAPLDVDVGQSNLHCRYCGCAIEVVRQGSDREYRLEERREPSERPMVPRPASLRIDESGGGLAISWRWFSPALIFLAFFCVAWDSFLLVWYSMAMGVGIGGMAAWPIRLLMLVFPLAHVAVGVGLTYFVLAGLLNTTAIIVDDRTLRVTHRPIPWKRAPPLATDDVDQIYVTQSSQQSDERNGFGYAVNVLQADGGKLELVKRLTDADKALYIADRLRRHLDIEPRPVSGEYTG